MYAQHKPLSNYYRKPVLSIYYLITMAS